ncbi:CDP-glycerol glycerophosphotransferase family protein [Pseudotenacibaculum sp. MALMAid0570]|uniref:CDP-glycerol glycerophosphotransferase family protein n=1 Tax=Pseudotenacibaculum sp. MALMAid0570 TaxID=3143938 RepID=UPI0032DE8E7E
MRKKIFIAIAFGTSVRDVLRNDTFKVLKEQENLDLVLFLQDTGEEIVEEFGGDNVSFETILPYQPTLVERFLLPFHKAILRKKSKTIDMGSMDGNTKTMDNLTPLANFLKFLLGYRNVNKLIFWMYRVFTKPKMYEDIFEKYKPDLVIVTRVLSYSKDYSIMRMAAKKKIPTISLVSSWDNLTSKGFFPFSLKSLVVWNNVMKQEAVDLFDFPKEKIFVSGIPRYDVFFREENFDSKQDFFEKNGLDISKKLIVYATGSGTIGRSIIDPISPERDIVKFIADTIKENNINDSVQLVVRLHPQAKPEHYQELINRKDVFVHIPGKSSQFQDRLFSKNDDVEFGEYMKYADLVINFGSTVTLDAAVFNTPIVCVNFDFLGERPYKISPRRIYEFDHYAKLKTTGGFDISESREELINDINNALKNPQHLEENRRKIVDQQCVFTDGKSGQRIAEHILKIINS